MGWEDFTLRGDFQGGRLLDEGILHLGVVFEARESWTGVFFMTGDSWTMGFDTLGFFWD